MGAWPTLDRYRLVLVALNALLTRTISSFSGTSAIGAAWFLAADSSSRPCEVPAAPVVRSGAVNGVHPSVGSRNPFSSALSLPLLMGVDPAMAAWLAGVAWAVCPFPFSRYVLVTLSLWSWSIIVNDRVVGHACPVFGEVPTAGTTSLPCCWACAAAWKKPVPLQKDTWPKIDPFSPFTQRPWRSAFAVAPTWVRFVPLNPKSTVTAAPAGSAGTTGFAAG